MQVRLSVLIALGVVGCVPPPGAEPQFVEPSLATFEEQEAADAPQIAAVRDDYRVVGAGAIIPVQELRLGITFAPGRQGSLESQGRLEMTGLAGTILAAGVHWTGGELLGEREWQTAFGAGWRIRGGTVTLSDGTTLAVRGGTVTQFDDATTGMPIVLARLEHDGAAASVAPAAAPPSPPVRFGTISFTQTGAHEDVSIDVDVSHRDDITAADLSFWLTLDDEVGAPIAVAAIAEAPLLPGQPFRLVGQPREGSVRFRVAYRGLALAPGERRLRARIVAQRGDHSGPVLASHELEVRLTMPRFYEVRLQVGDIEVEPVRTAADVAATLTFCISCLAARPHGVPRLTWIATAGHQIFHARTARPGYRVRGRHDATPRWIVSSMQRIRLDVYTQRVIAIDKPTVFGSFSFSPAELGGAVAAGASISAGHVRTLRLDGTRVVELDMTRRTAATRR